MVENFGSVLGIRLELKSISLILFIMDFLLSRATPFMAAKSGSAAKYEVAKPRRQHAVLNRKKCRGTCLPFALGVFVVTLLKMLTRTRKRVTKRAILPGIISGGTTKLGGDIW